MTALAWVEWATAFTCPVVLCICSSVCFSTISQKPMQLGSPNLTLTWLTMSPGNPFILGSKIEVTRHKKRLCLSVEESWRNAVCLLLGFPCITSARLMLLTAGYSMRGVFCSQPVLVRVMALLMSVLASSSSVFSRCICFCFLEALKPVWSCGLNVSDDICLLYHLWTYNLVVIYKCVYLFIILLYLFIYLCNHGWSVTALLCRWSSHTSMFFQKLTLLRNIPSCHLIWISSQMCWICRTFSSISQ